MGFKYSRFYCKPLAAFITYKGREVRETKKTQKFFSIKNEIFLDSYANEEYCRTSNFKFNFRDTRCIRMFLDEF